MLFTHLYYSNEPFLAPKKIIDWVQKVAVQYKTETWFRPCYSRARAAQCYNPTSLYVSEFLLRLILINL